MGTSHHLVVVATDGLGGALSLSSVVLKQGTSVSQAFSSGSPFQAPLSGLAKGKYELWLSFSDRPDHVFPLSLVSKPTGLAPQFAGASPLCCSLAETTTELTVGETERVFTLTFKLGNTHSEVILVAGWDYKGGANNVAYCESCRDDLYSGTTHRTGIKTNITKRIDDATVVTFFDFKTGDRLRMVKGSSGWFEMDRVLQGTVKTHLGYYKAPASMQKRYLDDSISVKHVYDYIADLGAKASGALREFHIFSHAWAGGPILLETYEGPMYDAGGALEAQRDPHDKDPRTKDFDLVNMPRLNHFKAAFAPDAVAKIWGCMDTHAYRNLIRAASKAASDATPISFDWEGTTANVTAGEAKQYLTDVIMANTYMAKLMTAVGGGVKVYGAPPGMGANLRAVLVGKKTQNYMYVNSLTYKLEFSFLRTAFGKVPDDTGYILY